MSRNTLFSSKALLLICCLSAYAAEPQVQVTGLFGGAAVLTIDGREQLLKKGQQSKEGITLIEADSNKAVVSYQGETQTFYLSDHIGASFVVPEKSQVHIQKNPNNQYIAHGSINGRAVRYLIDTGANVVAINATMAASVGISLEGGTKIKASTASDDVNVTSVFIQEMQVGAIKQNNVRAVVIEGVHPTEILLGMTFLEHVDISEKAGLMVLTAKF